MEENLLKPEFRQRIIAHINGQDNIDRKSKSLEDCEIYSGDIYPYVLKRFEDKYSASTLLEIPIVSTINIAAKVVDSTSTIYKDEPDREFHEVTDEQAETLHKVYEDLRFDSKMLSANRYYKLQKQTHVMVIPKKGKLHARVIKQHQLDVIPSKEDPEQGDIYILTGFDKSLSSLRDAAGDGVNEIIADEDDYKATITRHVVWSKDYHFVMNGKGQILTDKEELTLEDISNPIGIIPIVEISEDKDLEYFLQAVNNDTKFTVDYNETLSNQSLVVAMQGFSQAVFTSPENLMPTSITIGPTKVLKIITNPDFDGAADFKFVNPNSDLAGVQAHTESLLAQFLSSKGLSPAAITGSANGGTSYSSGIERLLALMEKFEASKDDVAKFKQAEKELFKVISAWLSNAGDELEKEYHTGKMDNATFSIQFQEPTGIQTEAEILDIIERRIDLGLMDKVGALEKLDGLSKEQAQEVLDAITKATEDHEEGSITDVESENIVREGSEER